MRWSRSRSRKASPKPRSMALSRRHRVLPVHSTSRLSYAACAALSPLSVILSDPGAPRVLAVLSSLVVSPQSLRALPDTSSIDSYPPSSPGKEGGA